VSTTMVPVMCGCKEQKYSYMPGVVNVNENLSRVSSALDLKTLVLEATVCGTSSSLIQVTAVPAFTLMRCGAKANWSILISMSAARAEEAENVPATVKMASASAVATQILRVIVVLLAEFSTSTLQRLVDDRE